MKRHPFLPRFEELPETLPLFPLSGALVMPGVQLPLNIFEPRYLQMVRVALAEHQAIGMVQPRAEPAERIAEPPLHRVGCAGRITSYSETNDGRIVVVLTGFCRFEIDTELNTGESFRRARVRWSRFADDCACSREPIPEREGFLRSLRIYCKRHGVDIPWDDLEQLADVELLNLLCTHLPLSPSDKQALVETVTPSERALLMRGLMDMATLAAAEAVNRQH